MWASSDCKGGQERIFEGYPTFRMLRCARHALFDAFLTSVCVFVFVQGGGEALAEAMSHNTTLTECDIRMTDIEEQQVSIIDQMVWNNQYKMQKTSPREQLPPKYEAKF